jgi:hypothetical protein
MAPGCPGPTLYSPKRAGPTVPTRAVAFTAARFDSHLPRVRDRISTVEFVGVTVYWQLES